MIPSFTPESPRLARPSWLQRGLRRGLFERLSRLRHGRLTVRDGDGERSFGPDAAGVPAARVDVVDPRFYTAVATGGTVGAGESYVEGAWRADDLARLTEILVRDRDVMEAIEPARDGLFMRLLTRFHERNGNSRDGSRRNIAAHYDQGNAFFELLLDPSMTYSSGIFESDDASLHDAQLAKYDRIGRVLDLTPDDHVVEIGTGWGGFAVRAAERFGCRVTTTTISKEQHRYAQARVRRAGLEHRVRVLLEDYRDLRGNYDKLVSIEMLEAVGHQYYDTYFRRIGELLQPGGAACIQAILIDDGIYEEARESVDFIQRHVFPGSCIPSLAAIDAATARLPDLRRHEPFDMTADYARTLRLWRERLHANADPIRALGHDDGFLRLWEFYLAYCEGGFRARSIRVAQFVVSAGHARAPRAPRREPAVSA